jgi:hypothetical protein
MFPGELMFEYVWCVFTMIPVQQDAQELPYFEW